MNPDDPGGAGGAIRTKLFASCAPLVDSCVFRAVSHVAAVLLSVHRKMKRSRIVHAAAAMIVMFLAAATAAANGRPGDAAPLTNGRLVVRIYNARDVRLDAALGAAERIFNAVGIGVTWVRCGTIDAVHAPMQPACESTPVSSDVALQVLPLPARSLSAGTLGVAYLDAGTGTGTLASVFTDRIGAAAARLDLDADTLFGCVIAHEIGHLLGLRHQSGTYLMRAHWRDEMLQRTGTSAFQFSSHQARQLRDDVFRRVRAPVLSAPPASRPPRP